MIGYRYTLYGLDNRFDYDERYNYSFFITYRHRWDYSFIAVGLHGSHQTLELAGVGDSAWLSGSYNDAYLFENKQHAHIRGKNNHVTSWERAGATSIWLDGIDGTADLYGEKASVHTSALGISNAVGLHGKNETAYLYGQNDSVWINGKSCTADLYGENESAHTEADGLTNAVGLHGKNQTAYLYGQNDSAWINGQSCTTYLFGKNQSAHISSNTNSVKIVGKAYYSISFDGWAGIEAGSEESTIDVGRLSHGTITTVAGVTTHILGNDDGRVQVLIGAMASFSPPSAATVVSNSPPNPASVLLVTTH